MRRRIFIGSSKESLRVAETVQAFFKDKYEAVIWNKGFFEQNKDTYTQLYKKAKSFDYAIFIGGIDDKVLRLDGGRRRKKIAPRDNIYLELGLYAGILSPECTFFLINEKCNIASDLFGINVEKYKKDSEIISACQVFQDSIEKLNKQSRITLLPSTSLAMGYYNNYVRMLCAKILDLEELCFQNKTVKLYNLKKRFSIVIPNNFDIDIRSFAQQTFPDDDYPLIPLKDDVKIHYFRLDVKLLEKEEVFHFIDVPLNLNSAFEAVDLLSGVDFIGDDENRKHMKEREITNFINTLEHLVKKDAIAKSMVSIERK